MRGTHFFILCLVALGALVAPGTGCGGSRSGGDPATAGRATLSVRWPERGRLIPFASESVRVRVTRSGALLGEALLTRPSWGGQATAAFDRLPTGPAVFTATAQPQADGGGVVQAQAQVTATVVADTTVPVAMTLASTVDRLEVAPAAVTLGGNGTATITATARNAAGEAVFTLPATIEWKSLNPAVAAVEPGGRVRAVAPGGTAVEVKETESGKAGTVTVTVGPGPSGNVVCDPASGHCYEKVNVARDTTRFADLAAIALSRTYQGLKGHLATFSSQAEHAFLKQNFDLSDCTAGAFQDRTSPAYSEPNGGWRWVTDEPLTVIPWRSGEPNNVAGGEHFIKHFLDETWNDCFDGDWTAYLIEYEAGGVGGPGNLLLYDGFDYPAGSPLRDQNGGAGWRNAWNEYGQGNTATVVTASSLLFGNLKTTGRAVEFTSRNPIGHARVPLNQIGVDGTVLYFSILIRPLEVTGGSPDSYFGFAMGLGKPGRSEFYSIEGPSFNFVSTNVRAVPNQTVFLVGRVTYRAGSDIAEMWVNPAPGQPLPAPMATKSDIDLISPGDIGIGGSVRCQFDEFRVGTTWESVSPVGP